MATDSPDLFTRLHNLFVRRKIRVDIVTIFLILIGVSSTINIAYMRNRNFESINDLSKTIISHVGGDVVDSIGSTTHNVKFVADLTKGTLTSENITAELPMLTSYLINALNLDQTIYSLSIATANGSFISVENISISKNNHYFLHPNVGLPQGSIYAVRVINRSSDQNVVENWDYLDTSFNSLATECLPHSNFDTRSDPLFTSMQDWPHPHWTNAYAFGEGAGGMAVSVPAFDKNGKMIAMITAQLSLERLSNFITHTHIGISGKAFVFDNKGQIIIPTSFDTTTNDISPASLSSIYATFIKNEKSDFLVENEAGKFLVTFVAFPVSLEAQWTVAVVIPFNDFFAGVAKAQNETILVSIALLFIFGILIYFTSKHISNPISALVNDVDQIKKLRFEDKPRAHSHIEEIVTLDDSINSMRTALRSFTRYVPKDIIKKLIEQGQEIALGGERKELTVMFSDIADFTTYSESVPIEKLMTSLSGYFETITKTITQNEGTIDKYIGDCVMAFWGAPEEVSDHADKACLASLRCLAAYQKAHIEKGLPDWSTRIGINSGEVIVGNIGTPERMSYTAIGNTVNTASRLQNINKIYHTNITISQTVNEKIGTRFITRPLDFVAVKGRKNRIMIYELVGAVSAEAEIMASQEQIELCKEFTEAYSLFYDGKLEEAKVKLIALRTRFPSDYPTQLYLERIQAAFDAPKS